MILTWLIAIPIIGGLLSWIVSRWSVTATRWVALLAMAADLGLAVVLWVEHPVTPPGTFFLEQNYPWIPRFGISYHLGIDGLSLLLIVLTCLLGLVSVAVTWREITDRVGLFHLALLSLLAGIIGVFLSLDLFLFYFFWELMLIPMYFLIGLWGHENRAYAAIKFFLFTFISGLLMLVAIIGLYVIHGRATGDYTFDYKTLMAAAVYSPYAFLLMLGFFVGFAVKLPAVPFPTWLPMPIPRPPRRAALSLQV